MKMETKKDKTSRAVFYVCLSITVVLLVAGFIVPPPAVIDGSVLKAGALLFAFAALSKVDKIVEKGYDAKINVGKTSLEVNNPDNEAESREEMVEE